MKKQKSFLYSQATIVIIPLIAGLFCEMLLVDILSDSASHGGYGANLMLRGFAFILGALVTFIFLTLLRKRNIFVPGWTTIILILTVIVASTLQSLVLLETIDAISLLQITTYNEQKIYYSVIDFLFKFSIVAAILWLALFSVQNIRNRKDSSIKSPLFITNTPWAFTLPKFWWLIAAVLIAATFFLPIPYVEQINGTVDQQAYDVISRGPNNVTSVRLTTRGLPTYMREIPYGSTGPKNEVYWPLLIVNIIAVCVLIRLFWAVIQFIQKILKPQKN